MTQPRANAAQASAQLESVRAVRDYQRAWLARTRERVQAGEPFAICNGDEFEDVLAVMGIPTIVVNYWNSIIERQGKRAHYFEVLARHGYPRDRFALGLAATLDADPATAPWGGLPKPALILGSTKTDAEMRVLEIWADAYGCPLYPLEFSLDPVTELPAYPPPDNWWELTAEHWDTLVDPERLALRIEQERALIAFVERLTGKTLSHGELVRSLELVNEQAKLMGMARDLIARTVPCPVTLRDQLAIYQAMWHRGTPEGLSMVRAYHAEVQARVDAGVAAHPGERLRLGWLGATPPAWGEFAESLGAVCVCSAFSSIPIDSYYRVTKGDDPLATIAARHMVLFLETPQWRLKDAQLHRCDGVVELATRGVPSFNKATFEAAGMPLCEIPYDADDARIRGILGEFIERL